MKKAITLVFLCACIFIIYQVGVNFIKTTHTISYNIKNEKMFQIKEVYKNNKYYFDIKQEEYNFFYKDDNLFNKTKNVIKDIIFKEQNGIMCIYPIYEEKESVILCSDKKTIYSYESLKENHLTISFYNELKNKGYKVKFDENENNTTEPVVQDNITYYKDSFGNDESVVLWMYKGFTIYNSKRSLSAYPINFDRYDNTISTLVSKYYISPIYKDNKLFEFSSVYVYDVLANNKYELELGKTLSNDTYINGIIDNKLYLTDPSNIVQLSIEPKSKKVEIVGNKEENAVYYDGKMSIRNIYDFVNNKILFKIDDSNLKNKYNYNLVLENKDSYFFYTGTRLYQVYKDKLDVPILIIENNNLKQIKVKNNTLYYVLENKVYKYETNKVSVPLLGYNELLYNKSNMYDVYN